MAARSGPDCRVRRSRLDQYAMGLVGAANVQRFLLTSSPTNLSQRLDKNRAAGRHHLQRDTPPISPYIIDRRDPRFTTADPAAAESSNIQPAKGFHLHHRRRPRGRPGQVANLDGSAPWEEFFDRRPNADAGRYPAPQVGLNDHNESRRGRGRGTRRSSWTSASTACRPRAARTSPTAIDLKKLDAIERWSGWRSNRSACREQSCSSAWATASSTTRR